MKALPLIVSACLSFQNLFAAGSTMVEVSNVKTIEVHEKVIRIRADAMYKTRIVSDQSHGDAQVFGQPAQWIHGKIDDGIFEIKTYEVHYNDPKKENQAERDSLTERWKKLWEETKAKARRIKVGDSITISFQGEEAIISGFRIVKVAGPGTIQTKDAEQDASGNRR
jgi:hypothetical protein